MDSEFPVVIGVSGASGAILGVRIAQKLRRIGQVRIHLVVSDAARRTLEHEIGPQGLLMLTEAADEVHPIEAIGAAIASGSCPVRGMIVAPCSMRTLAAIATGLSDNLLTRAADVQLKERRPLVLLARETPLHLGHLRNMLAVTEMGAVVMPPVPAFYRNPATVEDIVDHLAARAIDQLRLPIKPLAEAWKGGA